MRGMPAIHSSAPSIPRHASSSRSIPLYGRISPKHSTTGSSVAKRRAAPAARLGEVRERAVRDHVHALGRRRRARRSAGARPCSECTTIASKWSYRRRCAARWPGARLARQDVVRGQHERAPARQQRGRRGAGRVSHWKCTTSAAARGAAVAQHVGHVLGELGQRAARAAPRRAPRSGRRARARGSPRARGTGP